VPAVKIRDLVLSYSTSNHLFRKILNYLASRGDMTFGKAINLLDKETLLFICKVLVNFGLEVSSRASLAFLAAYNGRMNELILSSNFTIFSDTLRFDYG
jgi:hypothetical protein